MLLQPEGVHFTFSCSGIVDMTIFQKVVADGALDACRDARIIHSMIQTGDHPVAVAYPEWRYSRGSFAAWIDRDRRRGHASPYFWSI